MSLRFFLLTFLPGAGIIYLTESQFIHIIWGFLFKKEKHIVVTHILQLILNDYSKMGIDWEHLVVSVYNIPFASYILIYHILLALVDYFNINLSGI